MSDERTFDQGNDWVPCGAWSFPVAPPSVPIFVATRYIVTHYRPNGSIAAKLVFNPLADGGAFERMIARLTRSVQASKLRAVVRGLRGRPKQARRLRGIMYRLREREP